MYVLDCFFSTKHSNFFSPPLASVECDDIYHGEGRRAFFSHIDTDVFYKLCSKLLQIFRLSLRGLEKTEVGLKTKKTVDIFLISAKKMGSEAQNKQFRPK